MPTTPPRYFDVAIIGAGIAGLTAAAVIEETDLSYLLVDQNTSFPISYLKQSGRFRTPSQLFQAGWLTWTESDADSWNLALAKVSEFGIQVEVAASDGSTVEEWNFHSHANQEPHADPSEKNAPGSPASLLERVTTTPLLGTYLLSAQLRGEQILLTLLQGTETVEIYCRTAILALGNLGASQLLSIFPSVSPVFHDYHAVVRVSGPDVHKAFEANRNDPDLSSSPEGKIDWKVSRQYCRDPSAATMPNALQLNASASSMSGDWNAVDLHALIPMDAASSDSPIIDEFRWRTTLLENEPTVTLSEFARGRSLFGARFDDQLRQKLYRHFPESTRPSVVLDGPEILGGGYYPSLGSDFRLSSLPVWVPGSSSGIAETLGECAVSGAYTALQAIKYVKTVFSVPHYVKISDPSPIMSVYTAQSKAFFYCRDVICEYCLHREILPLNPFRVFDYFLGDRLDRNLIRRANNHLIQLADEVWVFGPVSDGVLYEILRAKRLRKPIRFHSVGTRIEEIWPLSINDLTFEPEIHARHVRKDALIELIQSYAPVNEINAEQPKLDFGD